MFLHRVEPDETLLRHVCQNELSAHLINFSLLVSQSTHNA